MFLEPTQPFQPVLWTVDGSRRLARQWRIVNVVCWLSGLVETSLILRRPLSTAQTSGLTATVLPSCSPAAVAAAICRAQHSSALPALFSDCPAQLIKPNRTVECQWLQALTRRRGAAQDNTRTDMQPDCLIEQGPVVRIGIERHAHLGLGLRWGLVPPSSASCQNTHRRRYHPYRLRHW
ncbi:hypothetical protein CCHR01_09656 [Colletotrichum chrysophilum]|uniref:Uncharacterized protein n=1 Tax=Colletotrichum chrysophilum TaxID=1836956 RepID=A0AAD9AGB6_9PEZI|nr:hypothetical protein CCHR01_09656 [Colletotrichum chrysophilum]